MQICICKEEIRTSNYGKRAFGTGCYSLLREWQITETSFLPRAPPPFYVQGSQVTPDATWIYCTDPPNLTLL